VGGFLVKNSDALHEDLASLLGESSSTFVVGLYDSQSGSVTSRPATTVRRGKLAYESVGSKFRTQLSALLANLEKTEAHYVRCIKPNSLLEPGRCEGVSTLAQLRSGGMVEVLTLLQGGYPSRLKFSDLVSCRWLVDGEMHTDVAQR